MVSICRTDTRPQTIVYMSYSKFEAERGTEREIDSLGLTGFLSYWRMDVYRDIISLTDFPCYWPWTEMENKALYLSIQLSVRNIETFSVGQSLHI